MSNKFVDNVNGSNSNDGSTMDLAYATIEYACEAAQSVGNKIWIRRGGGTRHIEIPTSDINPLSDGSFAGPIEVIGWPRAELSITQADWTNGSNTVDNVVGVTLSRESHQARHIVAPDGKTYIITRVVDSNTLMIDWNYPGTTVTGANGASTIQADPDYALAQAIDDSVWVIKKADWNADADDCPCVNFNGGGYKLYILSDTAWIFKNFEIKNSNDSSYGNVQSYNQYSQPYFEGMLFLGYTGRCALFPTNLICKRCIMEDGSNLGTLNGVLIDCAIYGQTSGGINNAGGSISFMKNVNIGVEKTPAGTGIWNVMNEGNLIGVDVKIGHSTAISISTWQKTSFYFENWQKVLGAHKAYTWQGDFTKRDVVVGSGTPEKRTGGADSVIECAMNKANFANPAVPNHCAPIFKHEFEATTASKSYRYYVQSSVNLSSGELWLEAEYVDSYGGDTTEYHTATKIATGAITASSGATDWSQYIEITVAPAVSGKVRITCKSKYYHATNKFYIDPLAVII